MSKNASKRNPTHSRVDRFTQMSKQEEIIAEKKRLIEVKLKMMETQAKESAQSSANKNEITAKQAIQNTFSNDGSFLEKFKKISGGSNSKVDDNKSDKRSSAKPNKSYSNDNHNRSSHGSRWNRSEKDDQRGYQDYCQDSYNNSHKSQQNPQYSSYDSNYSSANHSYQRNNFPASVAHDNSNISMNNMRGQNYQDSQSFPNDPYMRSNNIVKSPPQYSSYSNNGNTSNNWNGSNVSNPMPNYNPCVPPRQISSNPIAHIPALTSLVIPPPSNMQIAPPTNVQMPTATNVQIPTSTNIQIPPPAIQPNLSVPPPNSISLQSIPEPKPLETTSIPRPGPLNLLTIPPPMPLCLNQIPKPKDIDVRNIPPPKQYNLSGIEMPSTTYNEGSDFYRKNNSVLSTDNPMSRGSNRHSDLNQSKLECIPIERVAKLIVEIGDGYEEIFKQKHQHEPEFWFLFHQDSAEYSEYKKLVKKLKEEKSNQDAYSPEELYEPEFSLNDEDDEEDMDNEKDEYSQETSSKRSLVSSFYDDPNDNNVNSDSSSKVERMDADENEESRRKRKRKSRWGNDQEAKQVISAPGLVQVPGLGAPAIILPANVAPLTIPAPRMQINKVTRTDRALLQYAKNTFGTTNLSEEDWIKAEDHFKINLLYQEMLRKRNELDQLSRSGKHKYEYDSDEEVEGGTWEHKLRSQEMEATQKWADELTKKSEGKHHIGDFLPPEELKKFMEKYSAAKNGREPDISDYKEYKLNENNVGFQMLQKLGWKDGEGLGSCGSGIVEPINKASNRESNQGLGLDRPDNIHTEDNEYDAYRKRMMLAYRFRPNPLNNPRRPYY